MSLGNRHTRCKSAGRWARGSLTAVAPCEASGFQNLKEEWALEEKGHRQRPRERAGGADLMGLEQSPEREVGGGESTLVRWGAGRG